MKFLGLLKICPQIMDDSVKSSQQWREASPHEWKVPFFTCTAHIHKWWEREMYRSLQNLFTRFFPLSVSSRKVWFLLLNLTAWNIHSYVKKTSCEGHQQHKYLGLFIKRQNMFAWRTSTSRLDRNGTKILDKPEVARRKFTLISLFLR